MSARAALDEVARRQDQTLAAGNDTWSWRSVLSTCAALLIMGVGIQLSQVWVAAVVVGCLVMLSATPLAQRRTAAQNARVTRIPATGSR